MQWQILEQILDHLEICERMIRMGAPRFQERKPQNHRDSLRAAKQPPVMKPEMMAFQASSFCRQPLTAQSNVENMPPQTPKLPPVTGARAFIVEMAPTRRSPYRDEM